MSTTAAAVLNGASSAAAAAGRPTHEVIVWALMGALVAVWLHRDEGEALTFGWVARSLGMIFVSVLSGIAGSAAAPSLADVDFVGFVAKLDRWVVAFTVAALIHKVAPLALRLSRRRLSDSGDHNASAGP